MSNALPVEVKKTICLLVLIGLCVFYSSSSAQDTLRFQRSLGIGAGIQKGVFGSLSLWHDWMYMSWDFGYNFYGYANAVTMSGSWGWIPPGSRVKPGPILLMSITLCPFRHDDKRTSNVSADLGWLSRNPKEIGYLITIGGGLKKQFRLHTEVMV